MLAFSGFVCNSPLFLSPLPFHPPLTRQQLPTPPPPITTHPPDVNDDGYSDVIISAHGANEAYVFYGAAVFPSEVISLSALSGDDGFIVSTGNDGDEIVVTAAGVSSCSFFLLRLLFLWSLLSGRLSTRKMSLFVWERRERKGRERERQGQRKRKREKRGNTRIHATNRETQPITLE